MSQTMQQRITTCYPPQRFSFQRRLKRLLDKPDSEAFKLLEQHVEASATHYQWRQKHLPKPQYPQALPVVEQRQKILEKIKQHPVVVLCGETGSGKTTQLPKICLELGRGIDGMIGCTQPRRIAARSIANRLSSELATDVGKSVGYQTRFHQHVSEQTFIKVMTDGILLAEIEHDRYLNAYDTIIIDEAHERSLNIDFLLGYFKWLLARRKDLKLVITSATIDTERFSKHFSNAPVIEVSGRTYPVEVRYHSGNDEAERDQVDAVLAAVDELSRISLGDILIFFSSEREIRETADALQKHCHQSEILPLFSRLSVKEQDRVFNPGKQRRIVLATNVAETSLTVPGIHYVIDTGYARISRYNHRNKVQRLPIEKISQSSAEQRKGRCGRLQNGVCIRLYSEDDYLARAEFTDPEILRTSLAAAILKMKILRLGDVKKFAFIDAPAPKLIKDGYQLLIELGALDKKENLTRLGKQLSRFPLDPRIARMVLAAKQEHCVSEILIIAGALTAQDPRDRPADKQAEADQAHQRFNDQRSDFIAYLNIWNFYQKAVTTHSKTKLRHVCREHFLSWIRMREWLDVYQQLLIAAKELDLPRNQQPADYDQIHRALLSGLLGNIGFKEDMHQYQGARSSQWAVFPGSSLFKRSPKWCVSAELIETSRLYAHCVAKIEPEWIEQVAGNLCKRRYFEPHWQKRSGQVSGYETVSLYGLTLVAKRPINFGPIDPSQSREIFIRSALVNGELNTQGKFMAHNQALLHDVEHLESKARRRDILVDEYQLYQFFEAIIPENIYNTHAFEKWRKKIEQQQPKLLFWQQQDLIKQDAELVEAQQYPETLLLNATTFKQEYHFNPADEQDGVSIIVPLSALNLLDAKRLDWLVPGLIREKIIALIKTLPKNIRRAFVPVPRYADSCLEVMTYGEGVLLDVLSQQLTRMSGVDIRPTAWREQDIPKHLMMNIQLQNDKGQMIAHGRNLTQLKQQWGQQAEQQFSECKQTLKQSHITSWDFEDLPAVTTWQQNGMTLRGFPALNDCGDSVSIEIFETERKAEQHMRHGVRRLAMLQLNKEIRYCHKQVLFQRDIQNLYQLLVMGRSQTSRHELTDSMIIATLDKLLIFPIRTQAEFDKNLANIRKNLFTELTSNGKLIAEILTLLKKVTQQLDGLKALPELDIRDQLSHLIYPGFIEQIEHQWLRAYPRYLTAISLRLERLPQNPHKDQQKMLQIAPFWRNYQQLVAVKEKNNSSDEIEKFRWLLEEFRVSLFAQELKTMMPVSAKRLQKQWQMIEGKLC